MAITVLVLIREQNQLFLDGCKEPFDDLFVDKIDSTPKEITLNAVHFIAPGVFSWNGELCATYKMALQVATQSRGYKTTKYPLWRNNHQESKNTV